MRKSVFFFSKQKKKTSDDNYSLSKFLRKFFFFFILIVETKRLDGATDTNLLSVEVKTPHYLDKKKEKETP